MTYVRVCAFIFLFNDPATTETYTLSLHDALPISGLVRAYQKLKALDPDHPVVITQAPLGTVATLMPYRHQSRDRKSTRLNSSHANISYAVFCLKKKKKKHKHTHRSTTRHSLEHTT